MPPKSPITRTCVLGVVTLVNATILATVLIICAKASFSPSANLISSNSTRSSRAQLPIMFVRSSRRASLVTELFQGISTLEGTKQKAVQGDVSTMGGTSSVKVTIATDVETVMNTLGISAESSMSVFGFGFGAKYEFFSRMKLDSFSTTVIVSARNYVGTRTATTYSLRPNVTPVMNSTSARLFFGLYGDSFVDSVVLGAEYEACLIIRASSAEEQEEVRSSLKASGIFEGLITSDSFQEDLNNFRSRKQFRMVRHVEQQRCGASVVARTQHRFKTAATHNPWAYRHKKSAACCRQTRTHSTL